MQAKRLFAASRETPSRSTLDCVRSTKNKIHEKIHKNLPHTLTINFCFFV